jgi:perosamine synthetase
VKNGQTVAAFEREFASYVGAKYAIALCNGTATLHTALVALGVMPGDKVAVPPLTMAATTIAVLHAGAVPVFVDVDEQTWLMDAVTAANVGWQVPVSLYGLNWQVDCRRPYGSSVTIDDAAQTLRRCDPRFAFTSYSLQASKILALGEGGMLVTNDEALATRAREFSSLGYKMRADQPRIDPNVLKSPTFERHHSLGWNYRMNDVTAHEGMLWLNETAVPNIPCAADRAKHKRQVCAAIYRDAIGGCEWLTPQFVPEGWEHSWWTFAVATDTPERCLALLDAVEKHGGERPFPAWALTYREPAFRDLNPNRASFSTIYGEEKYIACPVAESLQPRLCQFQTNSIASAEQNARALRKAIEELS